MVEIDKTKSLKSKYTIMLNIKTKK